MFTESDAQAGAILKSRINASTWPQQVQTADRHSTCSVAAVCKQVINDEIKV